MKRILSILAVVAVLALFSGMFALPASAAIDTDGFAAEVVRLVNVERAAVGLGPLNFGNKALNDATMVRAKEVATKFSHDRPNGSKWFTALGEYSVSYTACGENIAEGQATPADVVAAWMASTGHMKNIMGGFDGDIPLNFNWIGVAVCESGGKLSWVQLFVTSTALANNGDTNPAGGYVESGNNNNNNNNGSNNNTGATKQPNFFQRIWNWIVNLFKSIFRF